MKKCPHCNDGVVDLLFSSRPCEYCTEGLEKPGETIFQAQERVHRLQPTAAEILDIEDSEAVDHHRKKNANFAKAYDGSRVEFKLPNMPRLKAFEDFQRAWRRNKGRIRYKNPHVVSIPQYEYDITEDQLGRASVEGIPRHRVYAAHGCLISESNHENILVARMIGIPTIEVVQSVPDKTPAEIQEEWTVQPWQW